MPEINRRRGCPKGYKHRVRGHVICVDCGVIWPITTANRLRCPACVKIDNGRRQQRYKSRHGNRLCGMKRKRTEARCVGAARPCEVCLSVFIPSAGHHNRQIYCSQACRDAAHYPENKKRSAAWARRADAAVTALSELGIAAPSRSTALNALIELGLEI